MLKDHYQIEDYKQMIDEINRIFEASQKALKMAETAQFERRNEVSAEITGALENLRMLNRKKIDADVTEKAEEIRRHYY